MNETDYLVGYSRRVLIIKFDWKIVYRLYGQAYPLQQQTIKHKADTAQVILPCSHADNWQIKLKILKLIKSSSTAAKICASSEKTFTMLRKIRKRKFLSVWEKKKMPEAGCLRQVSK